MHVSTKQLGWDKETSTFSQEISQFQWAIVPSHVDITSEKTGVTKRFNFTKIDRDAENDVQCWWYSNGPLQLCIFND